MTPSYLKTREGLVKQHLETASAVLVLLVIGLAWVNEREEQSEPTAASVVDGAPSMSAALPLVTGPGYGTSPPAVAADPGSAVQHSDVPCSLEREPEPKRIKVKGGEIKAAVPGY